MSELTAAMQAALDSVETGRRRPAGQVEIRSAHRSAGVQLRDESDLPPITHTRTSPRTFTETLRELYGPLAVAVWTTLREAVLMTVLFWVCAILLAFVEVDGAVHVPGVGDATVITVAIVAATILRALLVAASRTGQPDDARRR